MPLTRYLLAGIMVLPLTSFAQAGAPANTTRRGFPTVDGSTRYDNGRKRDQFMAAMDLIVRF